MPDYSIVVQIKAHRLLICSSYKRRRLLVFLMKCFHILEASNTEELLTIFREKNPKLLQMLWTKAIGINATSLAGSHLLCHGATYFYISYLLTASLPSSWPVINCSFYCICFVLMSFLVSRLCLCFFLPPPPSSTTLRLYDIVLHELVFLFVFVYVCVFIPPLPSAPPPPAHSGANCSQN